MNNLGEILQEARKAKGVSLRDAADATKIRTDFLATMEQGDFNFDLPEIYKRGFLRLYAQYLELDENQIIADYNAFVSVSGDRDSQKNNPAKSQFLSRLAADAEESGTVRPEAQMPNSDFSNAPASPLEGGSDKVPNHYLKIGGILLGVGLLIIVIVFAVSAISKTGDSQPTSTQGTGQEFTLTITPLRDTFYKIHKASDPSVVLFSDEVRAGSRPLEFKVSETVVLTPKDRKDLKLERNGTAIDIMSVPLSVTYRINPPRPAQ